MGRSHSHRPSPAKVAQRKRQAAYGAAHRARKRLEREREREAREAAEQEALYADAPPPAPPAPEPPELLRCTNCQAELPASAFSPAAAERIRKGRRAWCDRCHSIRQQLLIAPRPDVRPDRVRRHGSRDA